MFSISVSYQTVLNYCEAAAYYCHMFNMHYKGDVDNVQAGDEAYIKVMGDNKFIFFFLSSKSLKITSYHYADDRSTLPAIITVKEAFRTLPEDKSPVAVTDGNPSYPSGIHFINLNNNVYKITHHKVVGLQNLDSESTLFRPFKQLIERLNRTYKYHIKAACGFKNPNGAISLTTLFVTHYNFLRPHMSLDYKTPVVLDALSNIHTIQAKWIKIIYMAQNLAA